MMDNFTASFYQNFIEDDRWKYITDGLFNTLRITFFAVLIGIFLGFLIAVVRSTYDKTHKLGVLNALCKVYLTVIRGTPVLVQLLIIYFVVFGSVKIDKTLVAVIAFGINSGAYVAEIFRSGIMSIDNGQFEAGRSLGFNYSQTMFYIVMPQAFKNVLPALGNEFIGLLKETGSDQGCRYYQKPYLQCIYAIDRGSADLSGTGYGIYVLCTETGEEVKKQ